MCEHTAPAPGLVSRDGGRPARRITSLALVLCLLVAGCQLQDPQPLPAAPQADGAPADDLLGNPDEDWPRTLAGLRAFALPEAQSWQDDPVLVDVTVFLDPVGTWERARLTYIAGDAERFLVHRSAPEQLRVERPLMEGLNLLPVPSAALLAIEALPDSALEPAALAEAARPGLDACDGGGAVTAVLYATGAPAAWDGESWTRQPTWRATVLTERTGVVVDLATGAAADPLTCVEPLLVDTSVEGS